MSEALDITRPRDNGKDFTESAIRLMDCRRRLSPGTDSRNPRIGIKKAIDEPLRFVDRRQSLRVRESRADLNDLFRIVPSADVGGQLA